MAAICSIIARRLHPVDYEYRRWTILAVVTVIFASFAYFRPVFALTWDFYLSLAFRLALRVGYWRLLFSARETAMAELASTYQSWALEHSTPVDALQKSHLA